MNPDQPSREQIETRLTALLLGELPADEAALLRYTMAQDPALQQLHDELQATLVLVREAAKHPAERRLAKERRSPQAFRRTTAKIAGPFQDAAAESHPGPAVLVEAD